MYRTHSHSTSNGNTTDDECNRRERSLPLLSSHALLALLKSSFGGQKIANHQLAKTHPNAIFVVISGGASGAHRLKTGQGSRSDGHSSPRRDSKNLNTKQSFVLFLFSSFRPFAGEGASLTHHLPTASAGSRAKASRIARTGIFVEAKNGNDRSPTTERSRPVQDRGKKNLDSALGELDL